MAKGYRTDFIRTVVKRWGRQPGVYLHSEDLIEMLQRVDVPEVISAEQFRDLLVEELKVGQMKALMD